MGMGILTDVKASISKEDYYRGLTYLLACTKVELQAVASSDTLPMWLVNRARALYNQSGTGSTAELRDIEGKIRRLERELKEMNDDNN